MGLFDKKYCDVCGEKIGLLGNRKLEDGNLCKDCAAKLSPWFSERRQSTVDDIRAQLDYRAENADLLDNFHETRVIGSNWAIHIDDNQGLLFVTRSSNWRKENPDILRFDQITGCTLNVEQNTETHEEEQTTVQTSPHQGQPMGMNRSGQPMGRPGQAGGPPGQSGGRPGQPMGRSGQQMSHSGQHGGHPGQPMGRSGQPMGGPPGQSMNRPGQPMNHPSQGSTTTTVRTYETYSYDFDITINVNCPWFNEISFRVNQSSVEQTNQAQYDNIRKEAEQIRDTLLGLANKNVEAINTASQPKVAVICPYCGASTIPDARGCCEYCGSAVC